MYKSKNSGGFDFKRFKPFLKRYLVEELNIDIKKHFRCLCPDHKDEKPSMKYWEGDNRVRCFAEVCGKSYDIYDVMMLCEQDVNDVKQAFALANDLYGGSDFSKNYLQPS